MHTVIKSEKRFHYLILSPNLFILISKSNHRGHEMQGRQFNLESTYFTSLMEINITPIFNRRFYSMFYI